jgi:hypothetical protein
MQLGRDGLAATYILVSIQLDVRFAPSFYNNVSKHYLSADICTTTGRKKKQQQQQQGLQ